MKEELEQLIEEYDTSDNYDDWDMGFRAGLRRAFEIIYGDKLNSLLELVILERNKNDKI
jgi:hypothetical protein